MEHHDTGLDAALLWMADNEISGALQVSGDNAAATLFFHDGRACFGMLDGEACIPTDGGGIDPSIWLEALASPIAEVDFAAALMLAGAPARAVSDFAHRSIERTVERLRTNEVATIRWADRRSPLGTVFRFDVRCWVRVEAAFPVAALAG